MQNTLAKKEACIVEAWTAMSFKKYLDSYKQPQPSDIGQLITRGYEQGFLFFENNTKKTLPLEIIKKNLTTLAETNTTLNISAELNGIPIEISIFEGAYVAISEGTYVKVQMRSIKDKFATKKHMLEATESLDLPFYINAMFALCNDFMICHFNAEIKAE